MARRRSCRPLGTLFDLSLALARADGVVPLGAFHTEAFGDDDNVTAGCSPVPAYWVHIDDVVSGEYQEGLNTNDPLFILIRKEESLNGDGNDSNGWPLTNVSDFNACLLDWA